MDRMHAQKIIALDALGQPDSAIAHFERAVLIPANDGLGLDVEVRPMVLERLGAPYEQQGQRTKALESYEALVALWKNAEPEQQRVVADVKARIAKLRRATGWGKPALLDRLPRDRRALA